MTQPYAVTSIQVVGSYTHTPPVELLINDEHHNEPARWTCSGVVLRIVRADAVRMLDDYRAAGMVVTKADECPGAWDLYTVTRP